MSRSAVSCEHLAITAHLLLISQPKHRKIYGEYRTIHRIGRRSGGLALHERPGHGAGIDILDFTAGRHTPRDSGNNQPPGA